MNAFDPARRPATPMDELRQVVAPVGSGFRPHHNAGMQGNVPVKTKIKLMPLALLALSECVLAQQIPGAGTQLNQLPPSAPQQRAEPQIRIEKATSPALPGAPSVS